VIIGEVSTQVKVPAFTNGIRRRLSWAAKEIEKVFSLTSNQSWLRNRIQTARREALAAATEALQAFMSSAELHSKGRRVNRIGTARLMLYKPGWAFQNAAHATELIRHRAAEDPKLFREYPVMEFQVPRDHPAFGNVYAQKLFCFTAGLVMQRYFPSESWMVVFEAEALSPVGGRERP
jgi:hypothetical protein